MTAPTRSATVDLTIALVLDVADRIDVAGSDGHREDTASPEII